VLLKKADVFKTVIPTKMLEFMACGRPVILGVDGQARQIIEEARAGIFVEPEDHFALSQAVIQLCHDAPLRQTLGRNGRSYIKQRFSREQTAHVYSHVLEKVVSDWARSSEAKTRMQS
jgi:glycosyltransferase involved in cell wall biosynthesis